MLDTLMYHYVRNNELFPYDVYSRSVSEFSRQLEFISKSGTILDPCDLDAILYYLASDSQRAYIFTFDDGYKDHLNCAHVLHDSGFSGIFFPPKSVFSGSVLDVNLIHYLLGSRDILHDDILKVLLEIIHHNNIILSLDGSQVSLSTYLCNLPSKRFDNNTTTTIKRLLQRDISNPICRQKTLMQLFKNFGLGDPSSILSSLYITECDAQDMAALGMVFGGHGLSHDWLNTMDYSHQQDEIVSSFSFLNSINIYQPHHTPKIFCYPYGGFNLDTIQLCSKHSVDLAFTTTPGSSKLVSPNDIYQLNRWDTNDFWNSQYNRPCLPI